MDTAFYIFLALTALTMIASASITFLKGRMGWFLLGFPTGIAWLVGALRLARPASYWARRFYGPSKMERARDRFTDE